jgi:hypothetical protein
MQRGRTPAERQSFFKNAEDHMAEKPKQGWGWPANSLKSHFFTESKRSLCMRWAFMGELETRDVPPGDACKECEKRLAKFMPKTTPPAASSGLPVMPPGIPHVLGGPTVN